MSDNTKIEWTDATWNVINGCTVISPGCQHCYAMRLAATRFRGHESREGLARMHKGQPQWTGKVLLNKRVSLDPIRWQRPRRIFVCAHGDLFHDAVPDEWINFVFYIILSAPQHTFQILTKRPERMRRYMQMVLDEPQETMAWRFAAAAMHAGLENLPREKRPELHWPPRNAWLGTSVEDQQRADERIPELLNTPAAIRWLSCEPLLGPVDLSEWLVCPNWSDDIPMDMTTGLRECCSKCDYTGIGGFSDLPIFDWVVAGGESGPDSRPMHPAWVRSLRDQCARAGVAFHFKQWGDWTPNDFLASDNSVGGWMSPDGTLLDDVIAVNKSYCEKPCRLMFRVGKKIAGRELDGQLHDGYPA